MPFKSDKQRRTVMAKLHALGRGAAVGAGIFIMLAAAGAMGKPVPGAPGNKKGPNFDAMKRVGSSSTIGYTNRMAKSRGKHAGALVLRRR